MHQNEIFLFNPSHALGRGGGGLLPNPHLQLDYDRRRKVAMKCLELEEMLMNQG